MQYLIQKIEPLFWRKVKEKAAHEGKPIRTIIISLLLAWLEDHNDGK